MGGAINSAGGGGGGGAYHKQYRMNLPHQTLNLTARDPPFSTNFFDHARIFKLIMRAMRLSYTSTWGVLPVSTLINRLDKLTKTSKWHSSFSIIHTPD